MAQPPFIFAAFVGPSHATITLRGHIDATAAEELAGHLEALLGATTRLVTINATDVTYCDPHVIELLARTRHRLDARDGAINVLGLHPSTLPTQAPGALDPAVTPEQPVSAGTFTRGMTGLASRRRIDLQLMDPATR